MKSTFTSFFATLILLTTSNYTTAQIEKTLVKAFNLEGKDIVLLEVDERSQVNVQTWNDDLMRITMTVSLENGSDIMLNSLTKVGRYNLASSVENGQLKVYLPELMKEVKLRSGNKLIEKIDFEIFAPSNVQVKTSAIADALAEETNSDL